MSNAAEQPYPAVDKPDFPAIEARILKRWADADTFQQSIDERPADNEYVFYDGPPFANGLPHHGHLLTGYVKDVVPATRRCGASGSSAASAGTATGCPPRWRPRRSSGLGPRSDQRLRHRQVQRGLPHVGAAVHRGVGETVTRQARWVDFENDYKTMDLSYMESVMWAFKQLWDKGLIYEANRVMPYCWGAETPLSNFEIRLDDATRPRQDPAITVAFDSTRTRRPRTDAMLAWTTTPWTLPSNLGARGRPRPRLRGHGARRRVATCSARRARQLREAARGRRARSAP